MDIYPFAAQIQKGREAVKHELPHKISNFQCKFYFPDKSPNILRNRVMGVQVRTRYLKVFPKQGVGFVDLEITRGGVLP